MLLHRGAERQVWGAFFSRHELRPPLPVDPFPSSPRRRPSVDLTKRHLAPLRLPRRAKIDCARLPRLTARANSAELIQVKAAPAWRSKIPNTDKGGSDSVGRLRIVCVEVERPNGPLRKWDDTLRAQVGALREQEALSCLPMDERSFMGRIEYSALGEMFLCKVAATHYQVTRSLTTPTPTLPIPTMLVSVSRGCCKFFQCGHTCILTARDWTLIDTKQSLGYKISSPEIEAFVTMLPRPSDAAITALFERGFARQSNGGWGLSRVLHAMVNESFGEMRRLSGPAEENWVRP